MNLNEVSSDQLYDVVTVNENFLTLDAFAVYGKQPSATSGLTWAYYGGIWGGNSITAGTLTLTNAATNYIVVARATGVISVSTASTNWDNTTDYARVYKVTTLDSVVTAEEDHRAGPSGVHGPSAVSVSGPASSTDEAVVRFNGTTGKLLQNSVVTIGDTGAVAGVLTLNKVTITAPATSATLTIADGKTLTASASLTLAGTDGKTLTVSNSITFTATDGSTLAIGTGGTLGTAAYTAASAYQPIDATLTAIAGVATVADRLIYFTGVDTAAAATFTAGGRAVVALTYAADKIAYTTSASAASTTDLTSVARTLIAQTTQATMRSTGLGLGTLTYPLMNYGGYEFDGSTDYLSGNALTGIADGKKGTFVCIIRFANAASAIERILHSTGSAFTVQRTASGNFQIFAENVGGTIIFNQVTSGTPMAAAGTYVIFCSWDLATPGSMRLYINDAVPSITSTTFTDDTIDYTVADYTVGATVGGANKFTGDIYLLWFDALTNQDFSVETVRRKFTDPNNVPMYLGARGELPTNTPPILFLAYSEFNNWPRNRGLATTLFTENGTPAAPTTTLYGQYAPVDNVGRAAVRTTNTGNVGSGEDNLLTYVVPANRLPARGCGVRITAWGTTANNANAKTLKVYFGSQIVLTFAFTTSQANTWRVVAEVFSTGVDTQDYVAQLAQAGTTVVTDVESGTATQDDGAAITIKCTGEATADNDIVNEGLLVELIGV